MDWVGQPLIPLSGSRKKQPKGNIIVNVDLASLPSPPGFLQLPWVQVHGGCITGADVAAWPCSVSLLCKISAFLVSLHWPADAVDMGYFGVSYLEVLIPFEQWAGHDCLAKRLLVLTCVRSAQILFLLFLCQKESKIRQGCQFIGSLVGALGKLPGRLGRLSPCAVGSHMTRLRHLGWDQCSHGFTSKPLESCHHQCLKAVCGVLG